jgi:hypothetical protein
MNKYVEEFTALNCSRDIKELLPNIHNYEKEVTEAYAVYRRLKPYTLSAPGTKIVYDFCAGNLLSGVLSIFRLPVKRVVGIDIRPIGTRKDSIAKIENYDYIQADIMKSDFYNFIQNHPLHKITKDTIITSVHPCQKLAERIIDIWNDSESQTLILMPCCEGVSTFKNHEWLKTHIGSALTWVYHLSLRVEGKTSIVTDKYCLSARNTIIVANKT